MVLLGAVASAKAASVARTEVLLPSDESSSENNSCVSVTRYDYNLMANLPLILDPIGVNQQVKSIEQSWLRGMIIRMIPII